MIPPSFTAALVLAALAGPPSPPPPLSFPALGDEVVEKVRTLFYDARSGEAWAKANAGYATEIGDAAAFSRITNERLSRLGVSHTHYYGSDDPGYADLLSIFEPIHGKKVEVDSLGLGLVPEAGGWFVGRVFAGGAAEKAGLLRGDRIATLDGAPFDPVRSARGKAGTPVTLGVERQGGAPLLLIAVTPRRVDPKAEWEEALRSGKEVVARALQRIGRATLVGERTAGAVVAGRFLQLVDGSALYLAVNDVRVDGERLEGKGVTPDLAVAAPLPYAGGRDPQLETALEKAAALAAGGRKAGA